MQIKTCSDVHLICVSYMYLSVYGTGTQLVSLESVWMWTTTQPHRHYTVCVRVCLCVCICWNASLLSLLRGCYCTTNLLEHFPDYSRGAEVCACAHVCVCVGRGRRGKGVLTCLSGKASTVKLGLPPCDSWFHGACFVTRMCCLMFVSAMLCMCGWLKKSWNVFQSEGTQVPDRIG